MGAGTFYTPKFRDLDNHITDRFKVPMGFNKVVLERVPNQVTSSYVTMVRKGIRKNDAILMAIIEVDHNWKELERERLKKML